MLNIKELEKQFDAILESFTSDKLRAWLAFAEQRELEERLQDGEEITLICYSHHTVDVEKITVDLLPVTPVVNNAYAMAA